MTQTGFTNAPQAIKDKAQAIIRRDAEVAQIMDAPLPSKATLQRIPWIGEGSSAEWMLILHTPDGQVSHILH